MSIHGLIREIARQGLSAGYVQVLEMRFNQGAETLAIDPCAGKEEGVIERAEVKAMLAEIRGDFRKVSPQQGAMQGDRFEERESEPLGNGGGHEVGGGLHPVGK